MTQKKGINTDKKVHTDSTDAVDEGMGCCPFCGADMERCDDSPFYGQTAMHPAADCWLSGNMVYHERLVELWNKRVGVPADGADRNADCADVYCADCGDGVEGRDGGLCGVCAMLLKEQKEAAEAALEVAVEMLNLDNDCPPDCQDMPCPKIGKLTGQALCKAHWRKWLREKAEGTVKGEQVTRGLKSTIRPAEASDTGGDDATS